MKPKGLDLFSGAGGCSMGYHLAGFEMTGVDIADQPRYPFRFVKADALEYVVEHAAEYAFVAASPPCQAYSTLGSFSDVEYPDLYEETRVLLEKTGLPWVMENVVGAPYRSGVVLCGSMFGLKVRRHRNFETSWLLMNPLVCDHDAQGRPVGVYGHGQFFWENGEKAWRNVPLEEAREAMGVDWMQRRELSEAIPPAYTRFVGERLLEVL